MTFESRKSDYMGFEKVELSAAAHLALHELQFCDLTSVCPFDQRNKIAVANGADVLADAVGKGSDQARACALQPEIEITWRPRLNHSLEVGNDIARLHEYRRAILDCCDSNRFGL